MVTLVTMGTPAHADELDVDGAFGLKGGVLTTGAPEVPENGTYQANGMTREAGDSDLIGMFGAGGAFGPHVQLLFNRTFGVETGLQWTGDRAKGNNDLLDPESDEQIGTMYQTQRSPAVHIPLLLKLQPPFEGVRPVLGVGVEFVRQLNSQLTYESEGQTRTKDVQRISRRNEIEASNYTLLQFTAGAEFDADPFVIPVELRLGYNLGWNNSFSDRVRVESPNADPPRFVYNGEYLGHLGLYVGVEYRWDITQTGD
jgi:hypothetical protein